MAIKKPENQDTILPTLDPFVQQHYMQMRIAAEKVVDKHPEMDSTIYTDYLTTFLNKAKEYDIRTHTADNKPIARSYVQNDIRDFENALNKDFYASYELYTKSTDPKVKAQADSNRHAMQLLHRQFHGETFVERMIKPVYDEEAGGFKWKGALGMVAGGAIGALMGNFISASAGLLGGGWMGALAIGGLGIAGAAFGGQMVEKFFPNEADTKQSSEEAPAPAPGQQKQPEKPSPGLSHEHDVSTADLGNFTPPVSQQSTPGSHADKRHQIV